MNREKHESSLLKEISDAGSTPAASTKLTGITALMRKSPEIRGFFSPYHLEGPVPPFLLTASVNPRT